MTRKPISPSIVQVLRREGSRNENSVRMSEPDLDGRAPFLRIGTPPMECEPFPNLIRKTSR